MDYEKLYKEAFERAKKWHNAPNIDKIPTYGNRVIEEIFPELAESENERIRKTLIDYFNRDYYGELKRKDILTWLEKQGESIEINPSEFDSQLNKLLKQFESLPKEDLVSSLSFYLNVVQNDGTYKEEKQGEQKETLCDKCKKAQPSHSCQDITALGRCYIENINTSTNKTEPKFKVGDWVVWQDKYYKVNYNGCGYELVDQDGLSTSLEYGTIDEGAHLWTIQDAKDGDILMANAPFIFNGNLEGGIGCPGAHCGINTLGKFQIPNYPEHWTGHTTTPATKEQRDTLFIKMKEAGYEWDSEKKELKKIVQQPTLDVEIPFGAKDSELEEVSYNIPNGYHAEIDGDKVVIKKGEQKPVECSEDNWSEEDEHRINDIIYFLDTAKKHYASTVELDACIDWLESLK